MATGQRAIGDHASTPDRVSGHPGSRCVVFTIQHPADVHFFKEPIRELETRGYETHVFVRENEVTVELLERFGIDHTVLVDEPSTLLRLAVTQVAYEYRLWRHVRSMNPDVIAGVGGVTATHVARLVGARGVAFNDTEHATLVNRLAFPFASAVVTPACFRDDLGCRQITYPGFQELAYLHPDRFTPDPGIREELSIEADERVVVVRISSWASSHDIGQAGFDDVSEGVERLRQLGDRVLLSSEIDLPAHVRQGCERLPPDRVHDVLAAADLYVGEGATMAAESAILGTPALYVNSLSMGYIEALHERYGLLFPYTGPNRHERALAHAEALLRSPGCRDWDGRQERLIDEAVDVSTVIVDVIENSADEQDPLKQQLH